MKKINLMCEKLFYTSIYNLFLGSALCIVEEKIVQAYEQHSVVVVPWLDAVFGNNNLLEGVVNLQRGACLLFFLRLIWDGKSRLDADSLTALVCDEIEFQLVAYLLRVFLPNVSYIYIPLINRIVIDTRFVVYYTRWLNKNSAE